MTATTPETTVETLPYKNPDLPASERIADLLSRMTLEEKVGQMMQLDARGGDLDELIVNKHCVCSIESGPCERVDVFHVSGRFWSTSACGEKRTPARPAWTSFPS